MLNDSWITGTVVRGSGLGKILGFPTANLRLDDSAERPPDGIYACWVKIDGKKWAGALHVGPRPAIHDETPTVEVHILDFDRRDLYGKKISLQLKQRLRDVRNFDSREELQAAIAEDCEKAKWVLLV